MKEKCESVENSFFACYILSFSQIFLTIFCTNCRFILFCTDYKVTFMNIFFDILLLQLCIVSGILHHPYRLTAIFSAANGCN